MMISQFSVMIALIAALLVTAKHAGSATIAESVLSTEFPGVDLIKTLSTHRNNLASLTTNELNSIVAKNPEEFVNILGGTDSRYDLSHGSTVPFSAVPWGFNTYAPQTDDDPTWPGWWFHAYDRRFFGLRVSHQPSPWISDYGNFLIKGYMPVNRGTVSSGDSYTGYSPKQTIYSPYLFSTALLAYSTAAEETRLDFAPTSHGGMFRTRFAQYDAALAGTNKQQPSTRSGSAEHDNTASNSSSSSGGTEDKHTDKGTDTSKSSYLGGFDQTRRISIVLNGGNDMAEVGASPLGDGAIMISGYTTKNSGGVDFPTATSTSESPGHQSSRSRVAGGSSAEIAARMLAEVDPTTADASTTTTDADATATIDNAEDGTFAHYFAAVLYGGEAGTIPLVFSEETTSYHASSTTTWVDLPPDNPDHQVITVRFATSLISVEQALLNLQAEVGEEKCFMQVVAEAKQAWNEALSRAKITNVVSKLSSSSNEESSSNKKQSTQPYALPELLDMATTFYSSLYRASLFPRSLGEVTADGSIQHWSPYLTGTERVADGHLSTDSGFWDAWNTVYPLLTLTNRPQLGQIMQGWVNAYLEGGWLPKWASPGYRGSMVGTMGDVSLADAIVNDIPGFDIDLAYEAIRKDAFEEPPVGVSGVGRECLASYLHYGYIPHNSCSEVVARTLNYYQSDYAIAQAAAKLGFDEDAAELNARSANYSLLFDQNTGFFRSKYVSDDDVGIFTEPFDEFGWGGDYTEAGPWQYRFYVPYDPAGLAALYASSGRTDMCANLESVHTARLPTFHFGDYGGEIHEMTELADHCWGQYSHNNQPIHHMLYMNMKVPSDADGSVNNGNTCAAQGQFRIRQVLRELYTANADMFPGDEDNGEMGAWYVLSALGLYQLSPASGEYVLGSPLFGRVEIDISDIPTPIAQKQQQQKKKKITTATSLRGVEATNTNAATTAAAEEEDRAMLVIESMDNSKDNVYVQRVTWNDEELTTTSVSYATLSQGGVLRFYMGPEPPITLPAAAAAGGGGI